MASLTRRMTWCQSISHPTRCKEMMMSKQPIVMKRGQAEELRVTGAGLRFLCTGDKTDKAWSLMEAELAKHSGPPPHHHPWDEAYYVIEGEVRFSLGDREE